MTTFKGKYRESDKNDPFRFQGGGINFKAKLIGMDDVADARGDKMCQEAIQRLKNHVKIAGEHKQRIIVNVSLEGLKIIDEKTGNEDHCHAVHRISFISRDTTDARAFGYIYGPGGGSHKFFGIKTEKAAEGLVLTLRDLFQVVFELKKKEVEEAKKKKEDSGTTDETEESKQNIANEKENETTEKNKANETPVKTDDAMSNASSPVQEEAKPTGTGNLLDLENELVTIQEGINQMNAFSDVVSTTSDSQSEGSATPGPWGKPDAWGLTNGSQQGALSQPSFAAFDQQPAQQQTSAFTADFTQNATATQPDLFSVNAQAFSSASSTFPQPGLTSAPAMNAFSAPSASSMNAFSSQNAGFGTPGSSLFDTNTSPFASSTNASLFGNSMATSSPPPVPTMASTAAWPAQSTGMTTGLAGGMAAPTSNLFGSSSVSPPPSTQFGQGLFGNSAVAPPTMSPGGSGGKVQADPFKNDPFFTGNSTAASTAQMNNPFTSPPAGGGGFGAAPTPPAGGFGVAPAPSGGGFGVAPAPMANSSPFGFNAAPANAFGASDAFGPVPSVPASSMNSGSANPFEVLTPISAQTSSSAQPAPAAGKPAFHDPFGDLVSIGSGASKKDFFKDTSEKPSLASLKVGDDDSLVNADSGRGDSSSSPATSIEWATPPTAHKPTSIAKTSTSSLSSPNVGDLNSSTLSPPDAGDFNLPSPCAPPPPLPSIPGLDFSYAAPPPPPPRPGVQKQASTVTTTLACASSAASTAASLTTVQSTSTTASPLATEGSSPGVADVNRKSSGSENVDRVRKSSNTSSSQSPVIPRPRARSSQLKSQTSLQFTTDPFAESWKWPSDPTKNDPFTSDPFTSPLDPFGAFTKTDPFASRTEPLSETDPFAADVNLSSQKSGASKVDERPVAATAESVRSTDSSQQSQQHSVQPDNSSDSDPFAFVSSKKKESRKSDSDSSRVKDIESDSFRRLPPPIGTRTVTSDSPLSVNTDVASAASDPFSGAFNPFSSSGGSAASSPDPFVVSKNSPLKPKLVKQTSVNPFISPPPQAEQTVNTETSNLSGESSSSQDSKKDPFVVDPFLTQAPEVANRDPFLTDSFFSGKSSTSTNSDPFATFDPFSVHPRGGHVAKEMHPGPSSHSQSQRADSDAHSATAATHARDTTHNTSCSNTHSTASTSLSNPFDHFSGQSETPLATGQAQASRTRSENQMSTSTTPSNHGNMNNQPLL